MGNLAILGGNPIIGSRLRVYKSIGEPERMAVNKVMLSGKLSAFYGSPGEEYWGGPQVRAFEEAWSKRFRIKHTISVNSATSGLMVAMGAVGISPGDEVIVPPYTMSATVTAPIIYGGIPVFADIEEDTFGLDPDEVRRSITTKTKAIIAVNLFGHPARLFEIKDIADEYGLYLIEDNAQGPLAEDSGQLAGSIGHIGVFSLNFHKHIHTGEGGMCVTNDDNLALRMKLIRNHGENVVESLGIDNLVNLVGFNLRLTELQAAVGIEQLKSIDSHVEYREKICHMLSDHIGKLDGIITPKIRPGCRHVFYVWATRFKEDIVGINRDMFCRALNAEGFPAFQGYVKPLYLLPMFQQKTAIGSNGFPFSESSKANYGKGICPVAEHIYENEFMGFEPCAYEIDDSTIKLLIEAFLKVYNARNELKKAKP